MRELWDVDSHSVSRLGRTLTSRPIPISLGQDFPVTKGELKTHSLPVVFLLCGPHDQLCCRLIEEVENEVVYKVSSLLSRLSDLIT